MACGLISTAVAARSESSGDVADTATSIQDVLGLSGSARAAEFSKDKSFSERTGYTVASIWATAAPEEFWGIKSYFDGRAQNQDLARSSRISWDIREGYAQITLGRVDLRAGRQVIVWGRADKINPTDAWSARDFALLAPNDDDQRLGVATLEATWNAGAYRVIALWQPEWRSSQLPLPPLPSGLSLRNLAPRKPARQAGIKLDRSGEGIDWSISYSHSIDRTPDLAVLAPPPRGLALGLVYQPVEVFGADVAVPIGQFGLRGEVAYTHTRDQGGTDPLTKNRNAFAVLGVERTFEGDLNINAQYLYRRTFDFVPPSAISDQNARVGAEQVDLLSNQLARDMHGVSLRINYKTWNETLQSEIAAALWSEKGDSVISPKLTYAFTDRLKGILGGEIYHGPSQSFFGRLNHTSTGYVEFQLGL